MKDGLLVLCGPAYYIVFKSDIEGDEGVEDEENMEESVL